MNQESQTTKVSRRRHLVPAIMGLASSILLLFVGVTGDAEFTLWLVPAIVLCVIAMLLVARKLVPRFASWFQAGITFILAAIVGSLLIFGIIAVFMFTGLDTEYAPGYSEEAFKSIKIGDTEGSVLSLLGEPLSSQDFEPFVRWIYSAEKQPYFDSGVGSGTYTILTFNRAGRVKNIMGQKRISANSFTIGDGANYLKLTGEDIKKWIGSSQPDIRKQFGSPSAIYEYKASKVLYYSRSPSGDSYHRRKLGLDEEGKVVHIWDSIYWD